MRDGCGYTESAAEGRVKFSLRESENLFVEKPNFMAREPSLTNNFSNEIMHSPNGYGEQGLGGPCELACGFLIIRTEQFGIAPSSTTRNCCRRRLSETIN
jgi:hypothetical protein